MQLWYLSCNYIKSEKKNQRKAWSLGRHHMVKHSDKSHGKFSSVALDAPNPLGHEDMNGNRIHKIKTHLFLIVMLIRLYEYLQTARALGKQFHT